MGFVDVKSVVVGLNKLFALLLLMTGALLAAGEYLHIAWMYNLAVIGFGLAGICGGIRIMVTGQARGAAVGQDQWMGNSKYAERHSGVRARMIGFVLILAGAVLITLSALDLTTPGGLNAFWDKFLRWPRAWGLVLGLAGLMVTLMGIVRAKAGTAAAPGTHGDMVEAEFKLRGVMAAIVGLALLLVACALVVFPGLFLAFLEDLISK